jgi:hypothetical protein
MEDFFTLNPGFRSRIAHHIDFPDYDDSELLHISETMLTRQNYRLSPAAREAMHAYIERRREQPYFSNARSIRNALDRARLRQAGRLLAVDGPVAPEALMLIEPQDILASRVFSKTLASQANDA